jgi:hypothetical protein
MPPPTEEHRHLAARRHRHFTAVHPAAGDGVVEAAPARHSHLAAVFLALGDDVHAAPPRRSVACGVCALAAGVVLALAAPLAWMSPAPRDQPAATVSGKAGGVEVDDDGDGS